VEQIFIGGLADTADASSADGASLRRLLGNVSGLDSIEIVHDLVTGKAAGYGVVRVSDGHMAEAIARLNDTELAGRVLTASRMPLTLPGEMPLRGFLHSHAGEVLERVGVKAGDNVLDYGCGPGIFSVAAARVVGRTGHVFSVDVSERALQATRNRASAGGVRNIETILQSAGTVKIPLADAAVNAVVIYDVLHDIKDKHGLFKEARRVLRPQGFLSAFPMHWGNAPLLELMGQLGLFYLRDAYVPPNSRSPSHILNFTRASP
jgi:SAM-dependent methyltransferase